MKHYLIQIKQTAAWLLATIFLIGCAAGLNAPEPANMNTIEGMVWYRERMLLPPEAEVIITLEDVARMDVKSELIAETRLKPQGGPPFAFALSYNPTKINDQGRYALRARIEADNKLMFTSTEHIPAFHGDFGQPIEIMVSRVASEN